ncbi:MAG: ATP-dependent helicase, partial [Bacteroidota bacterium]
MKKKSEDYSGPAPRQERDGSMRPRAARTSNHRSSSDFVPPGRASQAGQSERSSYGDRPKRDGDRPTRTFSSDRPARSDRPSYGDRPARLERPSYG